MDFVKISLWLFTAILSVRSISGSYAPCARCACNLFEYANYAKVLYDQRDCFCFNNQRDSKKVPEVIYPGRRYTERLVFYAYKDLYSHDLRFYIANKAKQYLIPDLAFEMGDTIIDNLSDVIRSFENHKVIIDINKNEIEPIVIDDTIKTVTTEDLTVANKTSITITDELTVTTGKPTVPTEEPTITTEDQTAIPEKLRTNSDEPITITDKPKVTIKEATVTTETITHTSDESTGTTKIITIITDRPTATTEELIVTSITTEEPTYVSTVNTKEPTTGQSPDTTIVTDETTVTTKVPSTEEPNTTKLPEPTLTTSVEEEAKSLIIEDTTVTTKVPITKEPSTTKPPKATLTTEEATILITEEETMTTKVPSTMKLPQSAVTPEETSSTTKEPTNTEKPDGVTISPLPNDDTKSRKVLSLQDLYNIIQLIQKNKTKPTFDLWEQILIGLKVDKSQFNKNIELDKMKDKLEFEIEDYSEPEHDSYTFDLWFEQQLNGFSENDDFISLAEIKQFVMNILLENGMIVTSEGMLTDLQGTELDLRELKLRPILIGKPLNFGKVFEQKDHKSDFLIPSDSPYMQAIVVTLSNPSMILGMIPLGKTTIKKTISQSVPPSTGMVKEWVQNGNKYGKSGNIRQGNSWFNINGPKWAIGLKDPLLYSLSQNKLKKSEPKKGNTVITFKSPKKKYKVKSSRYVDNFEEDDLSELGALKNQLLLDQIKLSTAKDLLTAWQNDGVVRTGNGQALSFDVDDPIELEALDNQFKDLIPSQSIGVWPFNDNKHTNGAQSFSLNGDNPIELDALNNQLLLGSNVPKTLAKELLTGWQHLGHLRAGNAEADIAKLDSIDRDALNNKLLKGPMSSSATKEMLSAWLNRGNAQAGSEQVISFKADNPSDLSVLKNQLSKHPNLFGKAGKKLLAALQRNEIVKADSDKASKVLDLKKLDKIRDNLLKDPKIFANTVKKLFTALQLKGNVKLGNGEAVKHKIHDPRELEALRKQLLKNPKIFARAASKLLNVLEHNGLILADIAPSNVPEATSHEDSIYSLDDSIHPVEQSPSSFDESLSSIEGFSPSEDVAVYYDEIEDDITGRIVGGSAATGSGAPLSMKGRMKDN